MAINVWIIDADGVSIYLSGRGGQVYTGTDTPWTAQSTTPFKLANNDKTGNVWTPSAPPPIVIERGAPPFRVGADPVVRGYGNVDEPIGFQGYATTHDAMVGLLRLLRRALGSALTSRPAILAVQPDGASQPAYFEILSAWVQEQADSTMGGEARSAAQLAAGARAVLRGVIQIRRTPFAGRLGGGETVINGVTVANTGTGGTANTASMGTSGSGDQTTAGGPLNVTVDSSGLPWASQTADLFLATVASRAYTANTTNLAGVSNTTTGVNVTTISGVNVANFLTTRGLTGRVMLRATGVNTHLEVQVRCALTNGDVFFVSPWVRASGSGSVSVLLDMGRVPVPIYRLGLAGTPTLDIQVWVRSATGTNTAGTLGYVEWLACYTFGGVLSFTMPNQLYLESFVSRSGLPALPHPRPRAYTSSLRDVLAWRGRPPIYLPGAALYAAWRTPASNAHVTTEQAIITATHAPLYHTLRGNG